VYDILQYTTRTHGTREAYGYRDVINTVEEHKEITKTVGDQQVKETKTWKYSHLSDDKYITFLDLKIRF
jgi:long-chain acyl-CoA synthetase